MSGHRAYSYFRSVRRTLSRSDGSSKNSSRTNSPRAHTEVSARNGARNLWYCAESHTNPPPDGVVSLAVVAG